MKKTFTKLMLLAGLLMTATGAKAGDVLYAEVSGTTLTLKCGDSAPAGTTQFTAASDWSSAFSSTITTAVIDASCASFTGTSLGYLFYSFDHLVTITGLSNLRTNDVTDLRYMFKDCNKLTVLDLSSWNTAKVTNMSNMFYNCKNLTVLDLSSWNTAKVTSMSFMFTYCSNLKAIIVGDAWNTKAVTSSTNMFASSTALVGEDGTKGSGGTKTYAHTGAGGYLTKKTVEVSATNVGGDYWSTYYKSNVNRVADANTTVYSATQSGSKLVLTEVADKNIKAGEGVILKSMGATITLTSTTEAPAVDYTSDLSGVDVATAQEDGFTYYVLSNNSGIGFYKLNSGNNLAAQKAFLMLKEPVSAPELKFVFGNETTGVADVRGKMADGRSEVFDLQGRRVAQPTKGLYIVNGKKVVLH